MPCHDLFTSRDTIEITYRYINPGIALNSLPEQFFDHPMQCKILLPYFLDRVFSWIDAGVMHRHTLDIRKCWWRRRGRRLLQSILRFIALLIVKRDDTITMRVLPVTWGGVDDLPGSCPSQFTFVVNIDEVVQS